MSWDPRTRSERLARFLNSEGGAKFATFLDAMSQGNKFETALEKAYGAKFAGLDSLEREFKVYAIKNPATN